ncbi:MAG TPA: hypothetical protein VFV75_06850 [Candidatus Polarisedimenticolaceae bacterium]|nr:hypothetical protein [Candidatus Polarisedimenticolaceae bacterium]
MRRLGAVLLALAVTVAGTTAPARATACGGRPAVKPGCCCKQTPAPPRKPCCEVVPATSDAAVLSGVTGVAPELLPLAPAVLSPLPAVASDHAAEAVLASSPPGSPPVFLLDCTFRI